MPQGRNRLAARIAESDCRLCGQRGHWKAECPRRNPGRSTAFTTSKAQTANVLVSANHELDDDEADVYVLASSTWKDDVITNPCQRTSRLGFGKSPNGVVSVSEGIGKRGSMDNQNKPERYSPMPYYHKVRQCFSRLLQSPVDQASHVRKTVPECRSATPSHKSPGDQIHMHLETLANPIGSVVPSTAVMPQKDDAHVEQSNEVVMFASTHAVGILDLGASQTVMGQHQVPEFLANLPADVRKMVHERPVEMTFRFGNNSIVPCTRAMFVPVDQYWIKIAIVESQTPFLISNNVCQSLGAVIDTTRQSIFFKNLNCEMPLQLSGKKPFLLDFCALTALKPPTADASEEPGKSRQPCVRPILQVQESPTR